MIGNVTFIGLLEQAFENKNNEKFNKIVDRFVGAIEQVLDTVEKEGVKKGREKHESVVEELHKWVDENVSDVDVSNMFDVMAFKWSRTAEASLKSIKEAHSEMVQFRK